MKTFFNFTFTLILAMTILGCEKEQIIPESPDTQLFGQPGIIHPDQPCGSSDFTTLVDGSGSTLGTVEIANDANNVHVMVTMNSGRFLDEAKFFIGDANNLDNDGTSILFEGFQFQSVFNTGQNRYTFVLPYAGMGACVDVVLWTRVSTRNHFNNVIARQTAFLDGLPLYNIEKVKYCLESCNGNTNVQVSSN